MIGYCSYKIDARIRREAETLAAHPHFSVTVIVPKEESTRQTYLLEGVRVVEVNARKYRGSSAFSYLLSWLTFLLLSLIQCTKAFLQREADIVHVHNMPDFLVFSAILPRLSGKRLVLDIHDTVPETYGAKFDSDSRLLFRITCLEEAFSSRLANRIIAVNHVQRDTLIGRGIPAQKIFVSMNVPDSRIFSTCVEQGPNTNASLNFRMVYHGTITERLGIDLALESFSSFVRVVPKAEFHIWGAGEYLQRCIELSGSLGLEHKVFFHSLVPVDRVPEALKGMHLGVVANRKSKATELMLPVKLLEYMALGIPVVAPRLKTIEHYFENGMVTLFEPGDAGSLTEAMLALHGDPERRKRQVELGKAFLDRHGWHIKKEEFLRFYSGL